MDTDNPVNSAYISDPGRKRPKTAPAVPGTGPVSTAQPGAAGASGPAQPPIPSTDTEMAAAAMVPATDLLNYTLRDVVARFGGLPGLERHAKAVRDMTLTAEKEQRMDERALRLVPKDFVMAGVLSYLNYLNRQIIEYPETAADKIVPKIIADAPDARTEAVLIMRDGISRIIAGAKEQAIKELNGLRGRHGQAEAGRPEEPAPAAGPEASPPGAAGE